ncbi:MAG: hypothetical protein PHE43_03685 [Candidatus Nanoarchaeia archaeon]|nr:hypothetical protein [Candidatus Nanoarchaeia archaeon]
MIRSKKRIEISFNKLVLGILILVVLIWLIFFSGFFKKNCEQDETCFNERLLECKSTKFVAVRNGNIYDYVIEGSKRDSCVLNIELRKMAIGTDLKLKEKLEGKSMICYVPKDKLDEVKDIEGLVNYCSGGLKEGIYEVMIEKLYGLLVQNLGDIVGEVKKQLFKF